MRKIVILDLVSIDIINNWSCINLLMLLTLSHAVVQQLSTPLLVHLSVGWSVGNAFIQMSIWPSL